MPAPIDCRAKIRSKLLSLSCQFVVSISTDKEVVACSALMAKDETSFVPARDSHICLHGEVAHGKPCHQDSLSRIPLCSLHMPGRLSIEWLSAGDCLVELLRAQCDIRLVFILVPELINAGMGQT